MSAMTRTEARHVILREANGNKRHSMDQYYMRHLHRAVCRCRRLGLVPDSVLTVAGFNARRA